jgi:hypothetical protein
MSKPAFELYDALGEFFLLQSRSATLDGSIPLRAAQHCIPYTEGCSAGLQLIPPLLELKIKKKRKFEIATLNPPDPQFYEETLHFLRHNGILSDHWWHILENGPVWDQGDKAYIWTGYMIRPVEDTWILNGGAYNRRAQVKTIDLIYADSKNFQPLFCALDLSEMKPGSYQIAAELGCLLGLQPGIEVKVAPLENSTAEVKTVCDFFDDQYYEQKKTKPATGKYRALKSSKNKPLQASSKKGKPEILLVDMLGSPYTLDTFKNFVTSLGIGADRKLSETFKFIILKSSFSAKLDWDGTYWQTKVKAHPLTEKLIQIWTKIGSAAGERFANTIAEFVWLPAGTESFFNVAPWVLLKTPPGWSSVYDGIHFENAEGLRGVVRTDQLYQVSGVYRLINGPTLSIKKGSSLMRILPIPRNLLNPGYQIKKKEELTLKDLTAST